VIVNTSSTGSLLLAEDSSWVGADVRRGLSDMRDLHDLTLFRTWFQLRRAGTTGGSSSPHSNRTDSNAEGYVEHSRTSTRALMWDWPIAQPPHSFQLSECDTYLTIGNAEPLSETYRSASALPICAARRVRASKVVLYRTKA
jgi:hypothetical protein